MFLGCGRSSQTTGGRNAHVSCFRGFRRPACSVVLSGLSATSIHGGGTLDGCSWDAVAPHKQPEAKNAHVSCFRGFRRPTRSVVFSGLSATSMQPGPKCSWFVLSGLSATSMQFRAFRAFGDQHAWWRDVGRMFPGMRSLLTNNRRPKCSCFVLSGLSATNMQGRVFGAFGDQHATGAEMLIIRVSRQPTPTGAAPGSRGALSHKRVMQ